MADEADQAHELEQLALEHALSQRMKGPQLRAKGSCYNCDHPLAPVRTYKGLEHVQLFCDQECTQDYEAQQRARRNRGG